MSGMAELIRWTGELSGDERVRGGQRVRGRRLVRPVAAAAVLLSMAAIPALAAKPEAGCWGYCGGPFTSHTPYFQVENHHVDDFTTPPMACLGTYRGTHEWIGISKKLSISSGGGFSYKGQAERVGPGTKIRVRLTARFVTAKKAKGTLTIRDKHCGPYHFTVRRVGG